MQHSDRNPQVSNPHQRHGYSLLELLITLALVIWLGSLSIANLGKIKGQIHRMTCTSHLRQWGLATILFASDHDDWLPMDGSPNGHSKHQGWYISLPRSLGVTPYHQQPWRTNHLVRPPSQNIWIAHPTGGEATAKPFPLAANRHINETWAVTESSYLASFHPTKPSGCLTMEGWPHRRWNQVHTNQHSKPQLLWMRQWIIETISIIELEDQGRVSPMACNGFHRLASHCHEHMPPLNKAGAREPSTLNSFQSMSLRLTMMLMSLLGYPSQLIRRAQSYEEHINPCPRNVVCLPWKFETGGLRLDTAGVHTGHVKSRASHRSETSGSEHPLRLRTRHEDPYLRGRRWTLPSLTTEAWIAGCPGPSLEEEESDPSDHWSFHPPVEATITRGTHPIDALLQPIHKEHEVEPRPFPPRCSCRLFLIWYPPRARADYDMSRNPQTNTMKIVDGR